MTISRSPSASAMRPIFGTLSNAGRSNRLVNSDNSLAREPLQATCPREEDRHEKKEKSGTAICVKAAETPPAPQGFGRMKPLGGRLQPSDRRTGERECAKSIRRTSPARSMVPAFGAVCRTTEEGARRAHG